MERRRCNHHTLDEPLSTLECFSNVLDPKKSLTNKNHYIVASQDEEVRGLCREIRGVPLVYVKRSVMVMEPMAEGSAGLREGIERSKFRSGLRGRNAGLLGKRKRGEDEGCDVEARDDKHVTDITEGAEMALKKKKVKGPKGPNPLSVKKSKKSGSVLKRNEGENSKPFPVELEKPDVDAETSAVTSVIQGALDETPNPPAKRKRKHKPKSKQLGIAAAINSGGELDE